MKCDTYAKGENIHDKTIQYVISVCIFSLLFISLLAGLAPNLSSKVVALGESIWPNYAQDPRKDLPEPECPWKIYSRRLARSADISNIPTKTPKDDDVDPFANNTKRPLQMILRKILWGRH